MTLTGGTVRLGLAPAVFLVVGQVAATDSGDDASRRLSWVIVGLVVLAVVIAAATVVFWRMTKPGPAPGEGVVRWDGAAEVVQPPSVSATGASVGMLPEGGTERPGGPPDAG